MYGRSFRKVRKFWLNRIVFIKIREEENISCILIRKLDFKFLVGSKRYWWLMIGIIFFFFLENF